MACAKIVLVAVGLGMLSCAQQGAPQGGPPDDTPPTVESTQPAAGDASVPRGSGISFRFSEPIDKTTFAPNLQISPSRQGKPEIEWSDGARHVDITWPDTLRDSTTYRVMLTNRVADRRANKFVEPYTFAFSTGPHVDRGEVRGRVLLSGDRAGTFDVFAYILETMPDTFWLAPPDYATQTGTDLRFSLPYLRAGRYRLLLLTDTNRNRRLDQGEQFGLAPRDLAVSDDAPPESVMVAPTLRDTLPFEIRSCTTAAPGLIALAFSHPPDTLDAASWGLAVIDSTTGSAVDFDIYLPTPRRRSAVLLSGNWIPGTRYVIVASNIVDQRSQFLATDTCSCQFMAITDSSRPRVEWIELPSQKEAITASDPIRWVFSEPLDTTRFGQGATVLDTVGGAIDGNLAWEDPQNLLFKPRPAWPESVVVIARIDSTAMVDRSGTPAGAGVYQWRINPMTASQFGAIEGRIDATLLDTAVFWLEARAVGDSRRTRVRVTAPGSFALALPAGRWQLGGFVDADGDARWWPGSLDPFAFPEIRILSSDTLNVRARFTLEDIVLKM